MEAYRMRAQTCVHHADMNSPKKQMVLERLRRRIETYTNRQHRLLNHNTSVDPLATDQNHAETRLLHQRYLEAKAKKTGKKTDGKKTDGKDDAKDDEVNDKTEQLSRVKDEPVCKREEPSPEPSSSNHSAQRATPNQSEIRPPSTSASYDVGNVKEEPPSNPGSIMGEDIGSLVGDQVDDGDADLNNLVLNLPQDWDLGELDQELSFDRLVTELKTEQERLDSPANSVGSPASYAPNANPPAAASPVVAPMAASAAAQMPPAPAYHESTGPAARTLKQMAEQHQMSQAQPANIPSPMVPQPQKRNADGQVLSRKQFRGSAPQNPGPAAAMMPSNQMVMGQRFYPPQQQQPQPQPQPQPPQNMQQMAQQRVQQPQAQVPTIQQPMMHSMAYQQQHLLQQQQMQHQMMQHQPQMQHSQNYANQMAYVQRQVAYRPRPPGPGQQQNYGQQMFSAHQSAVAGHGGMMMPNAHCEVTARVPHSPSGSYGVIRVSAQQPMVNQNSHFMKCQSWTPPQVTAPSSMQGMANHQMQHQQLQQSPMRMGENHSMGGNYHQENPGNPQMMGMHLQQHNAQMFRPPGMPGPSSDAQHMDTTGVPKDLDFFGANFNFPSDPQDLFNSLESIVSNGCPPGGASGGN